MNQREISVGQPSCEMQDGMQPAQNGTGAMLPPSQGGSGDDPVKTAPAAPQPERWGCLPAALRDRPQWVLAGADKRPLTADGRAASSTDPSTWTDFDTACRAAAAKGLHIGYMLHESDPFACIDLDVKDETPKVHIERFEKIVAAFDSYTERSRSGKGLHVWVEGKIGKGRNPDALLIASPGNERSNVAVIMEPMNLREQADRDKLVQTLTECGWAGGVLCIDTLAHAANGIDENSSEMGEMIAIFRELQHRLGGVILIIHHSGKSQERGMRGWSGLHAAMDFVIECQRDKTNSKTEAKFVLTKVKDGSDGLSFAFAMQPVTLGMDDDGDEISSLIVCPMTNEGQPVGSAKQTRKGINAIDAETAAADDKFIYQWVTNEVIDGRFPSKNSLKGQLPDMKESYEITQDRVTAAIERLIAEESLMVERELKSPNGNVWIRPIDPPQVAK